MEGPCCRLYGRSLQTAYGPQAEVWVPLPYKMLAQIVIYQLSTDYNPVWYCYLTNVPILPLDTCWCCCPQKACAASNGLHLDQNVWERKGNIFPLYYPINLLPYKSPIGLLRLIQRYKGVGLFAQMGIGSSTHHHCWIQPLSALTVSNCQISRISPSNNMYHRKKHILKWPPHLKHLWMTFRGDSKAFRGHKTLLLILGKPGSDL